MSDWLHVGTPAGKRTGFPVAQRCGDGWRQWFASTGIQPCQVVYEDLARDRLAAANAVLGFLRLPQPDAAHLPPVRYRKQAGTLIIDSYPELYLGALGGKPWP